jgi:hypothetical protein
MQNNVVNKELARMGLMIELQASLLLKLYYELALTREEETLLWHIMDDFIKHSSSELANEFK